MIEGLLASILFLLCCIFAALVFILEKIRTKAPTRAEQSLAALRMPEHWQKFPCVRCMKRRPSFLIKTWVDATSADDMLQRLVKSFDPVCQQCLDPGDDIVEKVA